MKQLTVGDLIENRHEPVAPFQLELQIDGRKQLLHCTEVLRWLPGRRLVAKVVAAPAEHSSADELQVLKLFVGKGARRYQLRERQGLEWLRDAQQRVPLQIASVSASGSAVGLLSDYLADALPLDVANSYTVARLVRSFAELHGQGIWHEDAKLDNFLLHDGQIWFIDGDAIRRQGTALESRPALENLALLLAERPPRFDHELADLIREYCDVRHWSFDPGRMRTFQRALRHARRRRLDRYLNKTLRECTEFLPVQSQDLAGFRVRDLRQEIWLPLLSDPDAVMAQGELIKAGNSATVVRWQPSSGGSLIVKRYNVKSAVHAWRRSLRLLPRYRRAWQFGHGLKLFGIATARPLLLLERRSRWPRGEAWLVMEDLGSAVFDPAQVYQDSSLNSLIELMNALRQLGIEHGDTKAINFLQQDGRWHLIDLDAMRRSKDGWRGDASRFLGNFNDEVPPVLQTLLPPSEQ